MKHTLDEQIKYAKTTADFLSLGHKAEITLYAEMAEMYRDMAENLIAIRILRRFGDLAIDEVSSDFDNEQRALIGKEEANG